MRDSFVFYRSFYEVFEELPDDSKLKLLNAICEYALNENEKKLTGLESILMKLIKPILESSNFRK